MVNQSIKFKDIPQLIGMVGTYKVNVEFRHLARTLKDYEEDYGLNLNPDFQRGHVWTENQQIKYVEFLLQGGLTGRDLYFNSPEFNNRKGIDIDTSEIVCVDGLQRITAVLKFLNNELKVFGYYYKEFEDKPKVNFTFHINDLVRKRDLIKWYIEMNEGGTSHAVEEIDRVKQMLEDLN